MSRLRIGQLLEQMGKLSRHDIDEILEEQSSIGAKKTFGQIALTFGLCQPEHIWKAWADQLTDGFERVDLQSIGIDAQAVARLPHDLAARFCALPMRMVEDEVIIAISDPSHMALFDDLQDVLKARPRFVLADAEQIRQMIARYYPTLPTA